MTQNELPLDELAAICRYYPSDPYNTKIYGDIVNGCKQIAYYYLKKDYYIPKTVGRITYSPYTGQGSIHVEKTIQEYSVKGRNMSCVVSRKRAYDIRKINLALIIDNSMITTARGLGQRVDDNIPEIEAPSILEKIAAISIIEGNKRTADLIDIIPFTDEAYGPYNIHQHPYRKILLQEAKGPNRLDLALAKLLQVEWDMRKGVKHLVVLGTGIPEKGKKNLLDDIEVQETAIRYLRVLQKKGVKILYLHFTTDERFADIRVGSHSPMSFANKLSMHGITTQQIKDIKTLPDSLRKGIKNMLSSKQVEIYE